MPLLRIHDRRTSHTHTHITRSLAGYFGDIWIFIITNICTSNYLKCVCIDLFTQIEKQIWQQSREINKNSYTEKQAFVRQLFNQSIHWIDMAIDLCDSNAHMHTIGRTHRYHRHDVICQWQYFFDEIWSCKHQHHSTCIDVIFDIFVLIQVFSHSFCSFQVFFYWFVSIIHMNFVNLSIPIHQERMEKK